MFGHDPEVAAGYQDADIAMYEMASMANEREIIEDLMASEREYEERHAPLATESDAHAEWHRNSGVPMGTPGCPQDACHPDEDDDPARYAVTFKRLKNRAWGITGPDFVLTPGAKVVVSKRDGSSKVVTVSRVIWSGNGQAIASIGQGR